MVREPFHLSDPDILLLVDGELSRWRARRAQAHLTACWLCRSRLTELEGASSDFVSLHRRTMDPQLPASTGSRALLKARLAEAGAERPRPSFLQLPAAYRSFAYAGMGLLMTVLAARILLQRVRPQASLPERASITVPDRKLTPGATRPVSIGDVCSMPHEDVVRAVPGSLREQVFREYGIVNPRPQDYEIDYLIAPGLGGAEDIHNLWPEPSVSAAWNAHDKDALEERLHQLVCTGKLDLHTAQEAIATDWITAYKKYLGEDRYLSHVGPLRPKFLHKSA